MVKTAEGERAWGPRTFDWRSTRADLDELMLRLARRKPHLRLAA